MYFKPVHIIFPIGRKCRVRLAPQGPVVVSGNSDYTLQIQPFSGFRRYSALKKGKAYDEKCFEAITGEIPLNAVNGELTTSVLFPQEDRWMCDISYKGEKLERFEVYSLEDDLFPLTPYKGDNHMHSFMSDGKESPEYMAAACCRRGYDYCVPTDHHTMEASLRAKKAIDVLGVDLLILTGEEIHSPGNHVHIINVGGSASANDWYRNDPEGYEASVRDELAKIDVPMSDKDKWAAAASQVIFDKIHEYDGVAILCHPHWILKGILQESEDITDYLVDHKRFDVLELIAGGAFEEGTQMQISYYQELDKMPIVGSSDTHQQFGGRLEPGNFTVVFAESLSSDSIRESIRMGRCTAGNGNKFYGDYRLLKYTYFLNANYFPEHDQRCATLGSRLLRYTSSGSDPESRFAQEAKEAPSPSALFESLRYPE